MAKINLGISKGFIGAISWVEEHKGDLHKQYQGKWVAVYDNKVVAVGKKISSVEKSRAENESSFS
ncbi:MAG: hypothetical protein B5M48_01305 [Candidatus Omnitrophica bacterium 4484_213]|nr:MAG: hypothetical protein B5M48_01305 [Candidatus Omnitrophica bacterium 4484_213]